MSNSDKKEQWHSLLKMYFNIALSASEAVAWFTELRLTVRGWRHDSLTESGDPCKGDRAAEINTELCDVLRYIAEMDHIPRKAEGGRKDYHGKPTIKDVQLWVWIYQKNMNEKSGVGINNQFVDRCKHHIQRLVNDGRRFDAAMLASDPIAIRDCWNDIISAGGNRMYSGQEQELVFKFCQEIGLNISEEFDRRKAEIDGEEYAGTAVMVGQVAEQFGFEDDDEEEVPW